MALSFPRRIRHRRLSPVFGALVSTLIIVSGLLAIGGTVASAATVGTPTPIVGGQSGRCLDVPNSSTTNGTQVQLFDCTGQANQSWTLTAGRQLQVFGTKCLDANGQGRTNGTLVIIWDCNGQANQQWSLRS